jgi:hypothetical protein
MELELKEAAKLRGWSDEQINSILALLQEHAGYLYAHGHALAEWSTRMRPTTRSERLQLEPESERLTGLVHHAWLAGAAATRSRSSSPGSALASCEGARDGGYPACPQRLMYHWSYTGWQVDTDTWWQTHWCGPKFAMSAYSATCRRATRSPPPAMSKGT